ncbi:MAG: rod shape-determining protein MreD [Alphaproteobacteria bacterium]|nr:MAG: rod shape-determining protein MreD [Alphaproteobacteria bacterium]
MTPTIWTRLDLLARHLFPFGLSVLLIMTGAIHLPVPDLSPIMPSFGLIAVYYWAIHRPDLVPSWAVFVLGLFQDLLTGGPLGLTIIVLLALWAAVGTQRRLLATGSFVFAWAVFVAMAAAAFLLMWLLHGLVIGTMSEPHPAIFQYLTTVAVYPCCAWLFARAQRAVLH